MSKFEPKWVMEMLSQAVISFAAESQGSSEDDIDPEDMNTWYDENGNLKPGAGGK